MSVISVWLWIIHIRINRDQPVPQKLTCLFCRSGEPLQAGLLGRLETAQVVGSDFAKSLKNKVLRWPGKVQISDFRFPNKDKSRWEA